MSNIPGLLICPVEDGQGKVIKIESFTNTVEIPESHKFGNCRRTNDFEKLCKISDNVSCTYKCRDKRTDEIRILKKFKISHDFQKGVPKSVLRECNILNTLNHVNVIKSHGPVTSSSLENNYLMLDYCRFTLKDIIEKKIPIYEKSVVKCIVQQLFQGLAYIHSALIIHRDINTENIMFDDEGILKITGFNFSRFYNHGAMSPVQSEVRYRAPELLFGSKMYNTKVDMWSAGCLLAELEMMKPIFTGDSELAVLQSIFEVLGTPSENIMPKFDELLTQLNDGTREIMISKPYNCLKKYITRVSTPCHDIISNLLLYHSEARFSAEECLESAYFKESGGACAPQHLASILKNVKETATLTKD